MIRRWQALDARGYSIVTVIAADEAEAREKVRYQLDRAGRRGYLRQWVAGGERVRPVAEVIAELCASPPSGAHS